MKKLKVGIIFGGKTSEYKVSLQSAKNIAKRIDKNLFEAILLRIDQFGHWYIDTIINNTSETVSNPIYIALYPSEKKISFIPHITSSEKNFTKKNNKVNHIIDVDVIFPIIHGTFGEDGSLQGMFRMINLPFVGSDIQSSASCMDKDITKRLLRDYGFCVSPFITLTQSNCSRYTFNYLSSYLGLPLFIKPVNQGSSIGVSKVNTETQFLDALYLAFSFSDKILIEKNINGREIECAIIGNDQPKSTSCGEVIINSDFYSYNSKYVNTKNAQLIIPAKIDSAIDKKIRKISIRAYQILGCCGMARVDVFLTENNEIIINEINTLPGFTEISMYPKLWEVSGVNFTDIITRLIELAIERHSSVKKTMIIKS